MEKIQPVALPQPTAQTVAKASFWARSKHTRTAYAFLLPYLLVFFLFQFLPALTGGVISLTDWRILGTPNFVGVENYEYVLQDDTFWNALRNTLVFTMYTVVPMVVGGLLLAVLLNTRLHGRLIMRTIVFLPYAIMVAVVGLLWQWIYDQNFGLANFYLTGLLGIENVPWLTSTDWALAAVAITTIWWQIGSNMVIYLAGLQEIPEELYDAAKVDGANAAHRLWYITIPGLRLVHIFVIPMSVITSMRVFGQVLVMTQGGPIGSTYTLVQHLYSVGWVNFRMGEAAAVGVILFAITFVLTLIQLRYFRALSETDDNAVPSAGSVRLAPFRVLAAAVGTLFTLVFDAIGRVFGMIGDGIAVLLRSLRKALPNMPAAWPRWVGYGLMIVISILWLMPTAWLFSTALKPEGRLRELPLQWIPSDLTFDNFVQVVADYPIDRWLINSAVVAIWTTIVGLIIYSLAAYPLSRYRFRGKRVLFIGIMATMLIPIEATMIPLFIALAKLRIADSHFSLVMPVAANAFGLYLLVQVFQGIPQDYIDSARIDGASEFNIFSRIILPLSRPALVTVAILTFMASWNNFVWPFVISNSDTTRTLPVGLAASLGVITGSASSQNYGQSLAAAAIATLPPMVIFIFLQRYFVQGISMSGIKG